MEVGVGLGAGLPLLSETIWNEGEAIWYSRHASVRKYQQMVGGILVSE